LNRCVKLALTIQLSEHNQLSAEDVKEPEVIDDNIVSSKTRFIVVIPHSITRNRCFHELELLLMNHFVRIMLVQ
jgi:hypothetical protein